MDVPVLDVLCTRRSADGMLAIAAVNKHAEEERFISIAMTGGMTAAAYRVITVTGDSAVSYNDIDIEEVTLTEGNWQPAVDDLYVALAPHSVNVIQVK